MADIQLSQLINDLRQGKEAALSRLYDAYAPALLGVIMKNVPHQPTAEDLLQEVFVKIWQRIGQYDESRGAFFTWMLNIARNHAVDYCRSRKFSEQSKTDQVADYVLLSGVTGNQQPFTDGIGMASKLRKLPPEQQQIVYLAYYRGYTQDEISRELGVPLGTVKSRLRLAMNKLRASLKT